MHLRASEITLTKLLKGAGYATCHSGKWHLNGLFNLETAVGLNHERHERHEKPENKGRKRGGPTSE